MSDLPPDGFPGHSMRLPRSRWGFGRLFIALAMYPLLHGCAKEQPPPGAFHGSGARARPHAEASAGPAGHRSVLEFGALGDGVSDDTSAVQSAIEAAEHAGGGTVFFPAGIYRLGSARDRDGVLSCLRITKSNVTLLGEAGAELRVDVADARALLVHGGGTIANNYWVAPVLPLTGTYSRGERRIRLANRADLAGVQAGDVIFIRTGEVLGGANYWSPDSEINKVISTDPASGGIALAWPLTKPYRVEDYGATHEKAGQPAPYGISNVTTMTIENIRIEGLKITSDQVVPILSGGQVIHFALVNNDLRSSGTGQSMGNYRFARIAGNRIHLNETGALAPEYRWWLSTATGVTDVVIEDNTCTSDGEAYLHIHEGSARVSIRNNSLLATAPKGATVTTVSIRARAYEIDVIGNTVSQPKGTAAIYVDDSAVGGAVISRNTIVGAGPNDTSILVRAPATPICVVTSNKTRGQVILE